MDRRREANIGLKAHKVWEIPIPQVKKDVCACITLGKEKYPTVDTDQVS